MSEVKNTPPSKELALYQAVIDLLDEGMDINRMKVSDITTKAGIGKGTAYEYFKSKEELISKALLYYIEYCIIELEERFSKITTFKGKIYEFLDQLEQNFYSRKAFAVCLNVNEYDLKIGNQLKEGVRGLLMDQQMLVRINQSLMSTLQEEGVVGDKLHPYLVGTRILSQLFTFLFYLGFRSNIEGADDQVSLDQIKDEIYHNIIKLMK